MQNHHLTLKDGRQETNLFRHRLLMAAAIVIIATISLFSRLIYLQLFQYKHFTTLSTTNNIELHPLPPRRGLIYDRKGLLLATNKPAFNLVIIPNKVKDLDKLIAHLRKILPITDTDVEIFKKQLYQHRRFDQVPLKLKLNAQQVARFSVNRYRFPAASVKAQLIRDYPLYNAYSHVIGYVGRINQSELNSVSPSNYAGTNFIGKVGLEKYYESLLHGFVGYEKTETNASGQTVRAISRQPAVKGSDLYLTIDTNLQIAAEEALGKDRGAVVAIKPDTGEILALVSQPSYNPNLFVTGISDKDFEKIQNDPDFPMYNRALRGLFAPGSVVKPFVALEGLDAKFTTPDFQLFDPGWYQIPGTQHIFHDWKPNGHGWVDMTKAILESCDTYFFALSHKMGIKNLDSILNEFGFGQSTGIDIGEELPGTIPTPDWKLKHKGSAWYSGDTVQVGIGQGFLQITPLQLAEATAILANRGKHFIPHLVKQIKPSTGDIQTIKPEETEPVILQNPKNWDVVINAMSKMTTEGTGYRFGPASYSVAAKTGTAQLFSIKHDDSDPNKVIPVRLRDNSTFIAFAPINHPKIAIAVVDQNNTTAPIITRKVLDQYLITEHHLK